MKTDRPKYAVRELLRLAIASAIQNEEALIDAYSNASADDPMAMEVRGNCANLIKQLRAYAKRRGFNL